MKSTITTFLIFTSLFSLAQTSEAEAVKATVDKFFTAFHAQDSVGLKTLVTPDIVLQTIGTGKKGETILRRENYSDLVKSIISIPDSVAFNEKLLDYSIQVDGAMANAWTPYEFWVNDSFSHCGVNSFQMVKLDGAWKIIYLIDTRRREGCEGQTN
ncbi:nuclear transport factor 2 family protein [Maribacter algicola]|uniref:Nuclear transport factor 2 family protein n=1 Tax=Maribacter algicola TaxID=2498892 RepID=A0A3R8R6X6_9FLAO|nr:nuclear transport factor 2 family protein [Maribacter algicola]RRQ48451.1 nuclear transport factor 2 family protein [Maribacter algicola]